MDVLSLELMLNLNQNLLDAVQILLHTDDVFTTSPPPPPPPPSPEANEPNQTDGPMHLSDLDNPSRMNPFTCKNVERKEIHHCLSLERTTLDFFSYAKYCVMCGTTSQRKK